MVGKYESEIASGERIIVGVISSNLDENEIFHSFSNYLKEHNLEPDVVDSDFLVNIFKNYLDGRAPNLSRSMKDHWPYKGQFIDSESIDFREHGEYRKVMYQNISHEILKRMNFVFEIYDTDIKITVDFKYAEISVGSLNLFNLEASVDSKILKYLLIALVSVDLANGALELSNRMDVSDAAHEIVERISSESTDNFENISRQLLVPIRSLQFNATEPALIVDVVNGTKDPIAVFKHRDFTAVRPR